MSGIVSYLKGQAAEERIAQDYQSRGFQIVARRWRGAHGELDLILRRGRETIIVEVKSSKTLARALESLGMRQIRRILASAGDFIDHLPGGGLSDLRIDVAAMDGSGRIQIVENALSA